MTPHIEHEIYGQADAWRSALNEVRRTADPVADLLEGARGREVRFLGSGSSYYLGVASAALWGRYGWLARALPSAEQLLHPEAYPAAEPPLVVAVSRSGTTTEVLRALERMRRGGSRAIGITTRRDSPMEDLCDVVLVIEGARESSTVQTRSFSAQYLASAAIVTGVGADDAAWGAMEALPDRVDAWLPEVDRTVSGFAERFRRVYVLGTGTRWGIAMEGALKLKETSLTESEAFQTLEFRHGPMSMVDPETLVVGLVSDRTRDAELAVLNEMRELGAEVLAVGSRGVDGGAEGFTSLAFGEGAGEDARIALYLPPLQLLSYRRGVAKGLDPDHPRNLSFAVELEKI